MKFIKKLKELKKKGEKWCKNNIEACCRIHVCLGIGIGMLIPSILIAPAILPIAVVLILVGIGGHVIMFIED